MNTPPIVSPQEWDAAREEMLVKEKELTRARDALAAERRRMPRMAVEKDYAFEGPDGPASLLDLFDGRRQLIVYRFFFEPGVEGWPERGCGGCSFLADQVAHLAHLNARDTTLAFVSRAPQADIERWKARMGWETSRGTRSPTTSTPTSASASGTAPTPSSATATRIFRTYFIDSRGDEAMGSTWSYLDMTALGRQEEWEDSPEGYPQTAAVPVVELPRRVRGRRVIAHVGGVPLEEILPTLAGAGAHCSSPARGLAAAAAPAGARR